MIKALLFSGAALLLATPAVAQTAPVTTEATAAPAPVDPARLAAARTLIDTILPPATREQMMRGMMATVSANLKNSLLNNADLAAAMNRDPRIRAIMESFLDEQTTKSNEMIITALPGMVSAMTKAYARRFTANQMSEIQSFFSTPTGRDYMQASMTIMSDPDVAKWQRDVTDRSTAQSLEAAKAAFAKIAALQPSDQSQ